MMWWMNLISSETTEPLMLNDIGIEVPKSIACMQTKAGDDSMQQS